MSRVAKTISRLREGVRGASPEPEHVEHDGGTDPDMARSPARPRRSEPKPQQVQAPDELSARREMRDGVGNLACKCGNVWWHSPGVTISPATGLVTGHAHPLTCIECGATAPPVNPSGPTAP